MADLKFLKAEFLEYLEIEKNRSQKTIENYDHYLSRFFEFAGVSTPEKLTEDSIRKFRIHLNRFTDEEGNTLKKVTQNYHIIALRSFLKYLAKRDIHTVAAEKVELAKQEEREVAFLETDELARLIHAPQGTALDALRDKAILATLFSTGLRVSELCALNREDINFERGEFAVRGKGRKVRLVFLSENSRELLKEYDSRRKDIDEALFIRIPRNERYELFDNLRLTSRSVQRIVKKYASAAGIAGKHVSPHTLRHSYATDLLRNGADIRSVQSLLGHSSVTTTQIYTHITDKQLREVHEKFHTEEDKVK